MHPLGPIFGMRQPVFKEFNFFQIGPLEVEDVEDAGDAPFFEPFAHEFFLYLFFPNLVEFVHGHKQGGLVPFCFGNFGQACEDPAVVHFNGKFIEAQPFAGFPYHQHDFRFTEQ